MRATSLVLLLAICLPLQAGDPADTAGLQKAVEMFRSNNPAARAEGSKVASEELRKLLAPLLKAMKDPDPEVRRRVREAILSLVPNHGREEPKQPAQFKNVAGQFFIVPQLRNRAQVKGWQFNGQPQARLWVQPKVQLPKFEFKVLGPNGLQAEAQAQIALAHLGVVGHFVKVPKKGTGLKIIMIVPGSAAAKVGLIAGDTILTINKQPVNSWKAFRKAMGKKRNFSGTTIGGLRGEGTLDITVK